MARISAVLNSTEGMDAAFSGLLPHREDASIWDDKIPVSTFLLSLDDVVADAAASAAMVEVGNDASAFFGAGGAERPSGLAAPHLPWTDRISANMSGLLLRRSLPPLPPNASTTLRLLWGYEAPGSLPPAPTRDELFAKYRANASRLWKDSSAAWRAAAVVFDAAAGNMTSDKWVGREYAFNY